MSNLKSSDPKIIIALDYASAAPAVALAERLDPAACRLKVGKELFTAAGPQVIEKLMQRGFEIFLDLKFHDIPNTTAHACKAAAELGVWMVNVHALGGRKMLTAAADAVAQSSRPPKLIAVTMLTSMAAAATRSRVMPRRTRRSGVTRRTLPGPSPANTRRRPP